MKCPACDNELTARTIADVTLDICENGCGGIWFDNFELRKFDEPSESAGDELLEIETNPDVNVNGNKRYSCPKCDDIVMMRHPFSFKQQVTIDECPGCGGIWLDAGELEQIRELFASEEEREQATEEYVRQTIGKQLADLEEQDQAELARVRRFVNMFKWICPSAYIPGKQSWGAF
ncbi:MAG: zf-TFIIB domain-containing protein [Sedimentisphaerales bacterium]|nr:zf-TFIIB domain-containing protein [Sedimentisphaerales bacterium]